MGSFLGGLLCFKVWINFLSLESFLHSSKTNSNLQLRIKFFLVSEAFLFLSFFWRYFNFCLSQDYASRRFPHTRFFPSFKLIDRFRVPMLNTALLLTSRFYATFALHSLSVFCFVRVLFTFFQACEYVECKFSIISRTFGSIFFLATRFHRAHVLIGTTFLIVSIVRRVKGSFTRRRTVRLLARIWYWHFVDVIWIFLYLFFYASYYPLFN